MSVPSVASAPLLPAASLAHDTPVCAVVVFTQSGFSARLVSQERPQVPILAFTNDPHVRVSPDDR
jgi:pyruvate kinase